MYLDKNIKNRYTVGKELRKLKQLRKKDPTASVLPLTPELKAYKEELESRGLEIGPIDVGMFQTRNGLKYPGFIARETIRANSILLRVPVDCLLTTRDAFLSQIQKVFVQNPQFFSKSFSSDWQDRIILTYLLFEFQKGKKSEWCHLLQNLPRDIDYVAFWQESQLQYLQDSWVRRSIKKERERVLREQTELIDIAKKYPQFFDIKVFTSENITWIHVHLVTRCFGKYFEYTTMVPYAQLFNHECVDVYYTMDYQKDNPNNPNEELSEPRYLSHVEEEQADTSEGSYEASDVSCDDQEFEETEFPELKGPTHQSVASEIKTLNSYLIAFINFNDEVSLPFLEKTYSEMQNLTKEEEKVAMQRLAKVHSKNVRYLKLVKEFYFRIKSNRYTYGLRQGKAWKDKQKNNKVEQVDPNFNYFQGDWPKDKFDDFLMVCGSKDQFQPGSQVYFCYGRLPNRLLLMRYGIALQHNKYNHLFVRLDISDTVYKSAPLQRAVQEEIALKKYKRFKLKRTVFCNELVTYHRCLFWKYEQDPEYIFYIYDIQRQEIILKIVKEFLLTKLEQYSCTPQQNQKRLIDSSVGYHEYFAIVYRLEQQRILIDQIDMIDYALELVEQLIKGKDLEKMLRKEKNEKKLRMQTMMETYFKSYKHF